MRSMLPHRHENLSASAENALNTLEWHALLDCGRFALVGAGSITSPSKVPCSAREITTRKSPQPWYRLYAAMQGGTANMFLPLYAPLPPALARCAGGEHKVVRPVYDLSGDW